MQKNEEEISKIPGLIGWDESSATFMKYRRQKLRCLARIKLARESIDRAKLQLQKFPKSFDWLRVPVHPGSVPTLQELLPVLWEVEKRMRAGEKVFVYSKVHSRYSFS